MTATKTRESVRDALNESFRAHWTAGGEDVARIAWDDQAFDTTAVPDFVRFGLQHNGGTLAALGAGSSQMLRRFGIVSAVLYVRKGSPSGVQRMNELVELVAAFFEDPTFSVAGLSLEEPGFEDSGLVAGWQQVNFTAQARYDYVRTA